MRFYFWACLYKVVLEVVYVRVVAPIYSYAGLTWNPSAEYFFISYSIFFVLLVMLPKDDTKPSNNLVLLLFFTTAVPLLSFFWQSSQGLEYVLYVALCFVVMCSVIKLAKPLRVPLTVTAKGLKQVKLSTLVFLVSLGSVILLAVKTGGVDPRALNFALVYELRGDQNLTGVWGYLVSWVTRLLLPFCIVTFAIQKKRTLLILSILMQVFMYLSTGSKTTLFSVILLVAAVQLLKRGVWQHGIPKLYSLITVASAAIYLITDYLMAIALFPTRQLIIPAQISLSHFDFFSVNQKLHLSQGLVGRLLGLPSPYSQEAGFVVGLYNGSGGNWNAGFLADAFDNGGVLYMLVFSVILAIILKFVDSISARSENRYWYTAYLTYSIIILNDGSLLTSLFTWGLGLLLIFLYIVASQEHEQGVVSLQ